MEIDSIVAMLSNESYYSSITILCSDSTLHKNQWPLAGGTPTTLYSIWTYDNDPNLKYLTRVNSNPT